MWIRRLLTISAVLWGGCAVETASTPDPVGVTTAAIGDDDVNDWRGRKTNNKPFGKRKSDCEADPRVVLNIVPLEVCVGADLFFREPFGGNGRACGTCHTAQFDFTISPEFVNSLAPDDPLFVAEFDPALTQLEIPELMRDLGLIVENVDGLEDPTVKFVMRSVPHTFSMATSITPPPIVNPDGTATDGTTQPPIQRTGWSGDGAPAPGGLKQFQIGAITQHYPRSLNRVAGVDFVLPTEEQLNDIEKFVLGVGRTRELVLTDVSLTDPRAEIGRTLFIGSRCNGCHANAGANNGSGVNRNFDTGIETVRPNRLNTFMPIIPFDGGFGTSPAFNHDANGDGVLDSRGNGTFNTPPLIEAADTGPFFHNNAFSTIEDAVRFYTTEAFANSVAGANNPVPFNDVDIDNVGRFLRVLNASFNSQIAIVRLQAVIRIAEAQKNHYKGLQAGLIDAAQAEVRDAIAVLDGPGINQDLVARLVVADLALTEANANSSWNQRLSKAQAALVEVQAANTGLGTGLNMDIGSASVMF